VSAEDALRNLAERKKKRGLAGFPDLMILDVHLPGMNGPEAIKEIRRLYPSATLPVTLCSTHDDDLILSLEDAVDGATDYLFKPVCPRSLKASIVHQLNISRLQRRGQLLKTILPNSVIDRVQVGVPKMISDNLPRVTVIFSDIVNFTRHSASNSTLDVMRVLHSMFSMFDLLTSTHGVFKVETIGMVQKHLSYYVASYTFVVAYFDHD
jgi:CheY-like chemotaxis protein